MTSLYTSVQVTSAVGNKLQLHSETIPVPQLQKYIIWVRSTIFDLTYFQFEGKVYRQV